MDVSDEVLEYRKRWRRASVLRIWGRRLLIVGIAVGLVVCAGAVTIHWGLPTLGSASSIDRAPSMDIPHDARDIRYALPGFLTSQTLYEFDVAPASFLEWVDVHGWQPTAIGKNGVEATRFDWSEGTKLSEAHVRRGYQSTWQSGKMHGQVTYDTDSGRVYYYSHKN